MLYNVENIVTYNNLIFVIRDATDLDRLAGLVSDVEKEFVGDKIICIAQGGQSYETARKLVSLQLSTKCLINRTSDTFETAARIAGLIACRQKNSRSSSSQVKGYRVKSGPNPWLSALQVIPRVSPTIAHAIAQQYGSPEMLYNAYQPLSREDGRILLKDIKYAASVKCEKRVGLSISENIYMLFTATDPSLYP